MLDTTNETEYRQRIAQSVREADEDDTARLWLAVAYAEVYGDRIPELGEIHRKLIEEDTADVMDAVSVLECIVGDHPAHGVVARLYKQHNCALPADDAIANAIRGHADDLRNHPPPQLCLQEGHDAEGLGAGFGERINSLNQRSHVARIAKTELLMPERVKQVWRLCELHSFFPFNMAAAGHA